MTACERNGMLFDALLKAAACEAYEKEIDRLADKTEQSGLAIAPALDKRIEGLIKKSCRRVEIKRFAKGLGKAAACLSMLLAVSAVVLISVEATRNAIFNAVLIQREKYTEIKYEATSDKGGNNIYRPTYLPEGFYESIVKSTGNSTTIIYENETGDLIFFIQQEAQNASTLIDSENTDYSAIDLSGKTGHLFKARTEDDSSILTWEEDGIAFSMTSVIDSGELIKAGESVRK